jgi:ABC-type branched-subunit amino acid transport system substrate-binding protein
MRGRKGSRLFRRSSILVLCCAVAAALALTTVPAGAAAKPTGTPYKVFVDGALTGPQFAWGEIVDGVTAKAEAQNAAGGVNGHPLQVVSCDAQLSAAQSAACGQKAVSENVLAAVGSLDLVGAHITPMASANISSIGPTAMGTLELNSPNIWPLLPGTPVVFGIVEHSLATLAGCKSIVTMSESAASVGKSLRAGVKTMAQADGVKIIDNVVLGSGDPGPAVNAAIATGAQCIEFIATGAGILRAMTALRQVNQTIKVGTNYQSIVDVLNQPGAAPLLNGIYTADPQQVFSKANPNLKPYFKDMAKYAPNGKLNDFSLSAYGSMTFVIDLLQKGNTTAAQLSTAVQTAKVDLPNLPSKFSFTPTSPIQDLRSWNNSMGIGQMKGTVEKVKSTYDATKDFQKYWPSVYAAEPA